MIRSLETLHKTVLGEAGSKNVRFGERLIACGGPSAKESENRLIVPSSLEEGEIARPA
jgi:hypothetical protein